MKITPEMILAEISRQETQAATGTAQGALTKALQELANEDDGSVVDIISYIKAEWGMAEKPYPIQVFILKLIYGLPLDKAPANIDVWDRFRENIIGRYSEEGFLEYLYNEKRCNFSVEEYNKRLNQLKTKVVLRLGRRGTKSTMSQWIAAYTIYKLLKRRWPQEYYQTKKDQAIRITLVATGKDQAQDLLDPTRSAVNRSPYLKQYLVNDSRSKIEMTTQRNRELGIGSANAGIWVQAAPCSAKSLRGPANILALLEEYGHFYWELAGSNKSDVAIYQAVEPSTSDFKNPHTGAPEGVLLVISTPLSKESHMYVLEQAIWNGDLSSGLVLHIPSYWVNPRQTTQVLKDAWAVDRLGFLQEYEAEYLDQVESAFSREDIDACREDPGSDANMIKPGETTFMGVDLGIKNDGTSISIVAVDDTGHCRLIHHEQHRVGLGKYKDHTELDIAEMAARVDFLWNYYGCQGGMYDQWNAYGLKSHLQSRAKEKLEHKDMNPTLNDRIARQVTSVIQQKRVTFYYESEAWKDKNSLPKELVRLQRIQTSGDPPKIKLQAPNVKGAHDDQYSSLSRALWAAKEGTENQPAPTHGRGNPLHQKTAKAIRERAMVIRRQVKYANPERAAIPNPLRRRFMR